MNAEPPLGPCAACAAPLTVSVGFTGRRALASAAPVAEGLDRVFALMEAAARRAAGSPTGAGEDRETVLQAYGGGLEFRLLTGAAPGADRLAAERWNAAGLGEPHRLYPFVDSRTGALLTDDPATAGPEERGPPPAAGAWTAIDGQGLGLVGGAGHDELMHWLLRHSDVLVAVWDGAADAGDGGTAATVAAALERGMPVIWLEPGRPDIRLFPPSLKQKRHGVAQAMAAPGDHAEPCTEEALTQLFVQIYAPPQESPAEGQMRRDYFTRDPLLPSLLGRVLDRTVWRSYAWFRFTVGGLNYWRDPVHAPDADTGDLSVQPGYARIDAAFQLADTRATYLGAIHRSQQLVLSILAPVAVMVGVTPGLFPPPWTDGAHFIAAILELLLALFAFVIAGNATRAKRHRRWSDARRLAERLRAMRATWALNVDLTDKDIRPAQTWTEWLARATHRAAGPPQGLFGPSEVRQRRAFAAVEVIYSQINYHRKEHHATERIQKFIERLKQSAFLILVFSLVVFSVADGALLIGHRETSEIGHGGMPEWASAVMTLVSASMPSIAAGALMMEFTIGFAELSARSHALARSYERFRADIEALGAGELYELQELMRAAAALLVEDADSWRDRVERRRIASTG